MEAMRDGQLSLDVRKRSRKLRKCLLQLERHNPEVRVAQSPTKFLFVANSSVLCGVELKQLEEIFRCFDDQCEFVVFSKQRAYSFVQFQSLEAAERAYQSFHGCVPPILNSNANPFYMAFVENLPEANEAVAIQIPPDLRVIENFCDEGEERDLLAEIEHFLHNIKALKSRKVMHFGFEFDYDLNGAFKKSDEPIPKSCEALIDRMMELNLFIEKPDQLTVNIYDPGNGIPSHLDTHSAFTETIASLSLLSGIVMEFRDLANTSVVHDALLPRFSLAVMQGESRYRWKHGIAKRKYDINPNNNRLIRRERRISFTFRKVSKQKCQCPFVEYCDWDRNGAMSIPTDDRHGADIENDYVASVYESIANHFDTTRHAQWDGVAHFLKLFAPGTIVVDIGCGNGKYLKLADGLVKFGCDSCSKLCCIAAEKGCNVVCANALSLPFKSNIAGAALCIAVIHHLSTENRRINAIKEIFRVLKPGGQACITVWSMEQKFDDIASDYLKMRRKKTNVQMNRRESNGRLRVHEGRDFTQQDMLVPFQNSDGQRFLRYYHLFMVNELEALIGKVNGLILDRSFYEQGNWIVYVKKEDK